MGRELGKRWAIELDVPASFIITSVINDFLFFYFKIFFIIS